MSPPVLAAERRQQGVEHIAWSTERDQYTTYHHDDRRAESKQEALHNPTKTGWDGFGK
jgi:hypothetical protein